jgi:hypothetical protein
VRHVAWDFDVLREHARRVEQLGDDVGEAASAVRSLGLGDGAFGLLCSFLVGPAVVITSAAAGMIGDSDALLQRTGAQLRGLAADGEEFELDVVDALRALGGGRG